MEESTTTTITEVAQDTTQPSSELSNEQITAEIKVYLGQIGQNIIEVGKRLIIMKTRLQHGEWKNWLESNFSLSYRTAANFMACAERFSNVQSISLLGSTQMIQLLALPADETEQFIETKAAEGTPVENMTVKKLREEVQQWKARAEDADKKLSDTQIDLDCARNSNAQIDQDRAKIKADLARVQKELGETSHALYDANQKLENQEPRIVVKAPADYESTKQALEHANIQNTRLRQQLADRPVEVQVPADYHDNKRALEAANRQLKFANSELADVRKNLNAANDEINHLQHEIDEHTATEEYAATSHKLDIFAQLVQDLHFSGQIGSVLRDYKKINPTRYSSLVDELDTIVGVMKEIAKRHD